MHSIGTRNKSLTTINFQGALNCKLSTINNTVVYLHFMWQGLFPTKWSLSSLPFNTCASSPIVQISFRVRWARLQTSRRHSPMWQWFNQPATSDSDIPQRRSPNLWHSTSLFFWGWWLGPPCCACYTPTMATLSFYCRYQPTYNETQQHLQMKTYCTRHQCQKP